MSLVMPLKETKRAAILFLGGVIVTMVFMAFGSHPLCAANTKPNIAPPHRVYEEREARKQARLALIELVRGEFQFILPESEGLTYEYLRAFADDLLLLKQQAESLEGNGVYRGPAVDIQAERKEIADKASKLLRVAFMQIVRSAGFVEDPGQPRESNSDSYFAFTTIGLSMAIMSIVFCSTHDFESAIAYSLAGFVPSSLVGFSVAMAVENRFRDKTNRGSFIRNADGYAAYFRALLKERHVDLAQLGVNINEVVSLLNEALAKVLAETGVSSEQGDITTAALCEAMLLDTREIAASTSTITSRPNGVEGSTGSTTGVRAVGDDAQTQGNPGGDGEGEGVAASGAAQAQGARTASGGRAVFKR